jgi:hypothetical protein
VKLRPLLTLLVGALLVSALIGASGTASAGSASCATGNGGYTYAGHQATRLGHGVRATITQMRASEVTSGHVAGWIGVGGPGQGPNGTDEWIQVGIASMPGLPSLLYGEVTRPGRTPQFLVLEDEVVMGDAKRVAVLEMAGRSGWWRIWVDGSPATAPIHLAGSSGRWAPIATAESWNGGDGVCNSFSFRFEQVSVSHGRGGSWFEFKPGYHFLDGTYKVRTLASADGGGQVSRRLTSGGSSPDPYAFLASSS